MAPKKNGGSDPSTPPMLLQVGRLVPNRMFFSGLIAASLMISLSMSWSALSPAWAKLFQSNFPWTMKSDQVLETLSNVLSNSPREACAS